MQGALLIARNSANRGSGAVVSAGLRTGDTTRSAVPGAEFGVHGVMPASVVGASGAGMTRIERTEPARTSLPTGVGAARPGRLV